MIVVVGVEIEICENKTFGAKESTTSAELSGVRWRAAVADDEGEASILVEDDQISQDTYGQPIPKLSPCRTQTRLGSVS